MSNTYKHGDTVPNAVLINRLGELSDAVTQGHKAINREFDMRIPAELDRDADLVLSQSAERIKQLEQDKADLEIAVHTAIANLNDEISQLRKGKADMLEAMGFPYMSTENDEFVLVRSEYIQKANALIARMEGK